MRIQSLVEGSSGIYMKHERGRNLTDLRASHNERRIQYEVFMHPYHQHFDIIVNNSSEITYLNTVF